MGSLCNLSNQLRQQAVGNNNNKKKDKEDNYNRQISARAGILNLNTTQFWADSSLLLWGCPKHCKMFNSISGLYPLDA